MNTEENIPYDQIAWHQKVHFKFEEALYYFMLSVKPYRESRVTGMIDRSMSEFGISRWCAYTLFGNYDCILRVWLPRQYLTPFKTKVRKEIPNLQSIMEFEVLNFRKYWLFPKDPDESELEKVNAELVRSIQGTGIDGSEKQKEVGELQKARIIAWPEREYISSAKEDVKAFIALSPPSSVLTDVLRKNVLTELSELFDGEKFGQVAFMTGYGFCWALAKVISDYKSISDLTYEVARKCNKWGIATSTFLVNKGFDQKTGESVSTVAIGATRNANKAVTSFIPGLYKENNLGPEEIGKFEGRVGKLIEERQKGELRLDRNDLSAVRNFLAAAVKRDTGDAFLALYRSVAYSEKRLRDPLLETVGRHFKGKVSEFMNRINNSHKEGSRVDKIKDLTLLDILRGVKILAKEKLGGNPDFMSEINEEDLKNISDLRNTVMHHKDDEFKLKDNWENYLDYLLKLFHIRDAFEGLVSDLSSSREH